MSKMSGGEMVHKALRKERKRKAKNREDEMEEDDETEKANGA
jgi:hypothetical protein